MKKIAIIALVLVSSLSLSTSSQAQEKIGFLNSNEFLSEMPEAQKADKELQEYAKELQSALEMLAKKIQGEMTDFQNNEKTMTAIMKEAKQKEIMSMQQNLQEQQQSSQEKLETKREALFKPILDKVQAGIEAVAKANGYSYIMDASAGSILFAADAKDITPLLKKQLNL